MAGSVNVDAREEAGPTEVRQFGLIRRRPDLSVGRFRRHWVEVHGPKGLAVLPAGGARAYVQNHRVPGDVPGFAPAPFDGASEASFASLDAALALRGRDDFRRVIVPDMGAFIDADGAAAVVARGHDAPPCGPVDRDEPLAKVLVLACRRPGLDVAAFQARYLAEAAPWAAGLPALRCATHNLTAPETYASPEGGRPPAFDVVVELWWPDWAAFGRAWGAPGGRDGYLAALAPLADPERSSAMRVEEVRLLWPPP